MVCCGVNALKESQKLKLNLPMYAGKKIKMYNDDKNRETYLKEIEVKQNGDVEISILSQGGFVLTY